MLTHSLFIESERKLKTVFRGCFGSGTLLLLCFSISSLGGPLELVTVRSTQLTPAAGGNGDSVAPIVSADGRYVVFASAANNLDANSSNYLALMPAQLNVFLRDRAGRTTTLVSLNSAGNGGGNGDSVPRGISTNGQFVLFESAASNLVPGVRNGANNVFVRDVVHGSTLLVSAGLNGAEASGGSGSAVMTPDGHYIAFASEATNLVANDTNGIADVFVRDMQAGVTILASPGATSNSFALAGGASSLPAISADGRYVAFYSTATNVAAGVQTAGEVYLRDLIGGQTMAVSTAAHGIALSLLGETNVFSCSPTVSSNGQFVAYETCPASVPPGWTAGPAIIIRYDTQTGSNDIVSTNAVGTPFYSEWTFRGLDMTPDGQTVGFVSGLGAVNLWGAQTAIEVWSAQTAQTATVSDPPDFTVYARDPALDSTGRHVVFEACGPETPLYTNADGHVETHQWLMPQSLPDVTYRALELLPVITNNPDVWWVGTRTSARRDGAPNGFPSGD